jgi:very-short-patch-repair endonuclease
MDFLLLLPQRRRVVLEVDGRHHYASSNGQADPHKYATMVAEDRRLRLAGYEVFRFGGAELMHEEPAKALLEDFFTRLLDGSQPEHL